MLAVSDFGTTRAAAISLSRYYHLNTARLCQGHTSHEYGATRFAYLNTWTRNCLFRKSNRLSLALQKGELLRSRLSTDALSLASWLNIPRISALDPLRAASFLRREGPFCRTKTFYAHPHRRSQGHELSVNSTEHLGVLRDLIPKQATANPSIPDPRGQKPK